jgi:hypothetical protein
MTDAQATAIGRLRSTLAFYWSRPEVDDVQPAGSGYGVLIGESDRQLILDALEEARRKVGREGLEMIESIRGGDPDPQLLHGLHVCGIMEMWFHAACGLEADDE